MKYMVMECRRGYAVVMDEEGRFLKVANRQYEVGQLLDHVTPMQIPAPKNRKKYLSLIAVAACFVLLLTALLPTQSQPFASVYIKINPEVRIDLDRQDRVIGLEGVNEDGKALIQGYDYRKKSLELVTDELMDRAIDQGFLQADGSISLTLDSVDEAWVSSHSQALSDHIHHHLENRFTVTVEIRLEHGGHEAEHHGTATEPTAPPQAQPAAPTAPSVPATEPSYHPDPEDDWDDDDDRDDHDDHDDDRDNHDDHDDDRDDHDDHDDDRDDHDDHDDDRDDHDDHDDDWDDRDDHDDD